MSRIRAAITDGFSILYVIIRPEGEWHEPGVLDRSAMRPGYDPAAQSGPIRVSVMSRQANQLDGLQTPPQLLLCVDLQNSHLQAAELSPAKADVELVLAACESVLSAWRSRMWPVAHLKRVAQAEWFDPAQPIPPDPPHGWRPRPAEMLFEHPLPSAYSSPRFAEYMRHIGPTTCTLIGFALEETVLATVIDGFHRGHQFRPIGDALACRGSKARQHAVDR